MPVPGESGPINFLRPAMGGSSWLRRFERRVSSLSQIEGFGGHFIFGRRRDGSVFRNPPPPPTFFGGPPGGGFRNTGMVRHMVLWRWR